jgi:hypothetical protein
MSTAPPPSHETPGATAEDADRAPEATATPRRRWLSRRAPAEPDAAAPDPEAAEPTEVIPAAPRPDGPGGLRRERRRLLTEREETVYDLGGLAFELYRRDLLSDEVMRLRAGRVAELDDTVRDIDARLGEVERERRERRARTPPDPPAGCCLTCRATFRAEARFCWQCGARLVPGSLGDDQVTAAIPTPPAP